MKHTDLYFKFPIKVYSKKSAKEMMRRVREEAKKQSLLNGDFDEDIEDFEPEWSRGEIATTLDDILSWEPAYGPNQTRADVKKDGYQHTMVESSVHGAVLCLWRVEEFEGAMNVQAEKEDQANKKLKLKKKSDSEEY